MRIQIWGGICALFLSIAANGYERKPFVIAVAGGSASGKTYTAKRLADSLGRDRVTLLSADHYYAPQKQPQKFYLNGSINYDHPSAVDLHKLAMHLKYLRSGFPVSVQEYTYGRTDVQPRILTFEPKEFVIVEGIFALHQQIAEMADFRIFVDVDPSERFQRRLERDQAERGLTEEAVREYFERVVEPMHQSYVQPSALRADVVVESPKDPVKMAEVIATIRELSQKNRQTKFNILLQTYDAAIDYLAQAKAASGARILTLDQLVPTQTEVGYLNLSNKAYVIDHLIRQSAVEFDLPSRLEDFLSKNPIPVVEHNGAFFVIDHHHLLLALHKKGIHRFLCQVGPIPVDLDPKRLAQIQSTASADRLTWADLQNNSYRSLAALVRDLGHIRKTGKPHEEFEWAAYLKQRFESELQLFVTEEKLLEPAQREHIVGLASRMVHDDAAQGLPGYLKSDCSAALTQKKSLDH